MDVDGSYTHRSVKGEQMSISFLLDSTLQQSRPSPTSINLDDQALATSIVDFKETLKVSRERIQDIDRSTREQRHSSLWFSARRYRITPLSSDQFSNADQILLQTTWFSV